MFKSVEEAKKLMESSRNAAWMDFKREVLDTLNPPIPADALDFVHKVFVEGYVCGAEFVSSYMMQVMLMEKLKATLGDMANQGMPMEEPPTPKPQTDLNPPVKKNMNNMSSEELFKSIFGSSKPIIIPKHPKNGGK